MAWSTMSAKGALPARRGSAGGLLLALDAGCRALTRLALVGSAASILVAALLGSVDVVGTAFFNAPLPLTVELSSYLLPLVVFGALAFAQHNQEHVAVDLVSQLLPRGLQRALRFCALLAGVAVFALLAWRSGVLFLDSLGRGERASAVYPFLVWPFKLAVFVFLCVATLEFIRQIAWTLAGREWTAPESSEKEAA